jgi:sialic acid synthase SpsE
MSKIILDAGSGNTCRNDTNYIQLMYDKLKAVDTGKHEVIIKWQLFEKAGDNIPLLPECFEFAYTYGTALGYKVTSSVFDKNSLDFLLGFNPCFVKIANNRKLDWLIGEVPRKVPVIISAENINPATKWLQVEACISDFDRALCCVSKYPAEFNDYVTNFTGHQLHCGISDHTTDFSLFLEYEPSIIEWHYKLSDSTGLDAGPFARTPEQLSEVL